LKGGISPKITRAMTSNAMTTSVTKKAGNASTVNNKKACSDGGSEENRGGNSVPSEGVQ